MAIVGVKAFNVINAYHGSNQHYPLCLALFGVKRNYIAGSPLYKPS
jgi:hypothetical protein